MSIGLLRLLIVPALMLTTSLSARAEAYVPRDPVPSANGGGNTYTVGVDAQGRPAGGGSGPSESGPAAPCDSSCQAARAVSAGCTVPWDGPGYSSPQNCPPPPPNDPLVLAQHARATLALPAPVVHLSPNPPTPQTVNLPMWVWIDQAQWQALRATASVGTVSATATAEPLQIIVDPGTGDPPVVCNGPGVAYDLSIPDEAQHSDCTYTFPRSSANQPNREFVVKVALTYHVTWTAQGAPGGGDFGVDAGPQTSIPVMVREIQIVNGSGPPPSVSLNG